MKALTLWQPWATMIALGHKTIETRSHDRFAWLKGHQLAIHAGKRYHAEAFEYLMDLGFNALQSLLIEPECPRGAVVAVARVADARWLSVDDQEAACSDCDQFTFGLVLADVRIMGFPVPARGSQGVWEWTPPPGWSVERDTAAIGAAHHGDAKNTEEAREG